MFGFFNKKADKKEVELLKQAVQTGFNTAKQDINKLDGWIKHLNTADSNTKYQIFELQEEIAKMHEEIEELKNKLSISPHSQIFKQHTTAFLKQTPSKAVLNDVQTSVQTAYLDNLSVTERAIIFVLLNADMKLSYEDLAAMLGKNTATIRGQVNAIRQKSEGLIEEIIGENNKKRVFIPENVKEILLKSKKVKSKKKENSSESDYSDNQ